MKLNQSLRKGWCFLPALLLLVTATELRAENPLPSGKPTVIEKKKEEEEKNKAKASKKSVRQLRAERKASPVKLSPDLFTSAVHVTAKSNTGTFDFYVFSTDGTLVAHHKMQTGDKKKISGLAKGQYTYRVFAGDEEKSSGQFEVRN